MILNLAMELLKSKLNALEVRFQMIAQMYKYNVVHSAKIVVVVVVVVVIVVVIVVVVVVVIVKVI